jgi:hypothetical protein
MGGVCSVKNRIFRVQLTNGLQIFYAGLDTLRKNKDAQNISMEWLKHRNLPPPPDVVSK